MASPQWIKAKDRCSYSFIPFPLLYPPSLRCTLNCLELVVAVRFSRVAAAALCHSSRCQLTNGELIFHKNVEHTKRGRHKQQQLNTRETTRAMAKRNTTSMTKRYIPMYIEDIYVYLCLCVCLCLCVHYKKASFICQKCRLKTRLAKCFVGT